MATKTASTTGPVTAARFCEAYRQTFESGGSYEDLARTLGMTREAVHNRKTYYAKRGTKFPRLASSGVGGRASVNVTELNAILAGRKAR